MQDHITSNQHNPTQNFQKKSQKPQKFSKTQNLGLKMYECVKKMGLRTLTKWLKLDLGRKRSG